MDNVCISIDKVNYMVNYYTELLGVMYVLCDGCEAIKQGGDERCNSIYRNEIISRFSTFSEHNAIKTLKKLAKDYYFNYDAPVLLSLMLFENNVCRRTLCRQRMLIERNLFKNFINEIYDFETQTNFIKFYSEHKDVYLKYINEFVNDVKRFDPIGFLYKTLNIRRGKTLNINLMCAVTNANYGVMVKNKLYANIRPYKYSRVEGEPCFSYEPIYYTTLILHEFAHSFINDVVFECLESICIDKTNYLSVFENFDYGENIGVYIAETIIRAIECLYVRHVFKNDFESYVEGYINDGFVKIKNVIDIIDNFSQNNDRKKNFRDFVVDCVKLF